MTPGHLEPDDVLPYLAQHGLLNGGRAGWQVEPLQGGIINTLYRARGPDGAYVLKQADEHAHGLPALHLDRHRIVIEHDAIRLFRRWFPDAFPKPLRLDEERFVMLMESAPLEARLLKHELIAGRVDLGVAEQLGRIAGRLHRETRGRAELAERFANPEMLITVKVHLQCVDITDDPVLKARLWEIVGDGLAHRTSVLHGDLCPKNVLVAGSRVILLDLEECHWGDPALELGYLLAHYALEGIAHPERHARFFAAAERIWSAYFAAYGEAQEPLRRRAIHYVGIFLLSRIDGQARATWITDESQRERARQVGRRLVWEGGAQVGDVIAACRDLPGLQGAP